ncbi:MAG: hypothetical protein KDC27_14665 [Acidobacteria bacterium]|nr:hypothetical protein [Acidobacteriota bacterium]
MKYHAPTPRAIRLALLMLAALPLAAQPTISLGPEDGISFDQIGFDYGNGFAYPFSHWAGMWVAPGTLCESSPIQRGYINVETDRGWVVQNLLVDCQERALGDDPITAYFQLHDTTDHMTPAEQLGAKVTFSGAPPPLLPLNTEQQINFQLPHTTKIASGGCTEVRISALSNPPAPVTTSGTAGGSNESHFLPNPVNVQTASSQCFPMSIANSLQYLEDRYGLPVPNDHVPGLKGDQSLVGMLDTGSNRPVTNRRNGSGTPHRSMMRAKLQYIDDNDLEDGMVMRHQGRGFGSEPLTDGDVSVGTVFTVTSTDDGAVVTWDWICGQIKAGEDVELTYDWPGGGHAVRIYGCGKTNGRPWVRYLHDRDQSSDSAGLETVQVYMEDLDNDGTPNFGSTLDEVRFAWSESVTNEVKNGTFAPPQTTRESIVNAASFLDKKLTGGSIGTIFGVFRQLAASNLTEEQVRQTVPTELNGVQVLINGQAAPLFFAGEGQINFLVPAEIEPGEASLLVMVNGVPSDLVSFPVVEAAPGMFQLPASIAGPGRAVAQNQDYSINTPSAPAAPGEALILYLTGTGPTDPPIPTGELAPSSPLAQLTLDTTVTIGGESAQILFAGAAPGFSGLTQINVIVPALTAGDHGVVVTVDGVDSPEMLVAVGP